MKILKLKIYNSIKIWNDKQAKYWQKCPYLCPCPNCIWNDIQCVKENEDDIKIKLKIK